MSIASPKAASTPGKGTHHAYALGASPPGPGHIVPRALSVNVMHLIEIDMVGLKRPQAAFTVPRQRLLTSNSVFTQSPVFDCHR